MAGSFGFSDAQWARIELLLPTDVRGMPRVDKPDQRRPGRLIREIPKMTALAKSGELKRSGLRGLSSTYALGNFVTP